MEPIEEKRQALDRALKMILINDPNELRYIALELRRCIEAVVYEKLWVYRNRLPAEVARRWQPPQAFKALLYMEPNADRTKIVRFAKQIAPGTPSTGPFHTLGTDHRFSCSWLTKTYNKLGSYLHASWPFRKDSSEESIEEKRNFLQKVANELEPFVNQSFTSTLANIVNFECSECGTTIKANAAGVEKMREIVCLNQDCECRYSVTIDGNKFNFQLEKFTATCSECMQDINIPTNKLIVGYRFVCNGCNQKFKIVDQRWSYETLD